MNIDSKYEEENNTDSRQMDERKMGGYDSPGDVSHDGESQKFDSPEEQVGDHNRWKEKSRSENENHGDDNSHREEKGSRRQGFKIFIGGLSRNTTSETVQDYFSKFGSIIEAAVVCDKDTGRSRGFGFCTFASKDAMDSSIKSSHSLEGCELRVALPKDNKTYDNGNDNNQQGGRIFVGGLSDSTTEDEFQEYFGKFGKLVSATLMYDKESNRPRGFGFVIFEDSVDASKAIGQHSALGRACEAKRAHPRPQGGRKYSGSGRRPIKRGGGSRYDEGSYGSNGGSGGYGGGFGGSGYSYPPSSSRHYSSSGNYGNQGGGDLYGSRQTGYGSRGGDYSNDHHRGDSYAADRSSYKGSRRANPY